MIQNGNKLVEIPFLNGDRFFMILHSLVLEKTFFLFIFIYRVSRRNLDIGFWVKISLMRQKL